MSVEITVHFVDRDPYSYSVKDILTAKKYAHSITLTGFRMRKSDGTGFIYLPPAKIDHVEVTDENGPRYEVKAKELVETDKE